MQGSVHCKKINKDGIDVRIMQLRNSKCGLIFTRFYINYMGDELHVYGFMELTIILIVCVKKQHYNITATDH